MNIGDKVKVKELNVFNRSKILVGEILAHTKADIDDIDPTFGCGDYDKYTIELENSEIVIIDKLELFPKYKIIGLA